MAHGGSIVTVNAFYSPNSNTMIVPIGMLQDPLYWNQPKSLTFGAFGIVVGECVITEGACEVVTLRRRTGSKVGSQQNCERREEEENGFEKQSETLGFLDFCII